MVKLHWRIFGGGRLPSLILSNLDSCKHVKRSRHANLELLISTPTTPLSLGYDDEDDTVDSADSDVGAEMMEDPDSLRDEGVELNTKSHTLIKVSESGGGGREGGTL